VGRSPVAAVLQMLWDQVPVRPAGATTVEDYAREQEQRLREGLY